MTQHDDPLVTRARLGDLGAFEAIHRAHGAQIAGLVRRLGGANGIDEITQDVFVRAWRKLGSYRGDGPFEGWLKRIAVRVVTNALRRRARENGAAVEPAARPETPGLRVDLESAIRALPEGARSVFVLHDVEGFRHEEIAGLLGVQVGTSKSQLHRARALLRAALGEEEEP